MHFKYLSAAARDLRRKPRGRDGGRGRGGGGEKRAGGAGQRGAGMAVSATGMARRGIVWPESIAASGVGLADAVLPGDWVRGTEFAALSLQRPVPFGGLAGGKSRFRVEQAFSRGALMARSEARSGGTIASNGWRHDEGMRALDDDRAHRPPRGLFRVTARGRGFISLSVSTNAAA